MLFVSDQDQEQGQEQQQVAAGHSRGARQGQVFRCPWQDQGLGRELGIGFCSKEVQGQEQGRFLM